MTKIAIISQPEQGVLIDVGGCASVQEATQHLTSTLQVSSQFWEEQPVDLNFGVLALNREELGQILSTLAEVGVRPRLVFAQAASTKAALRAHNLTPAAGAPAAMSGSQIETVSLDRATELAAANKTAESAVFGDRASKVSGTECGALQAEVPSATNLDEGAPPISDTRDQAPNTSVQAAGGALSDSPDANFDWAQAPGAANTSTQAAPSDLDPPAPVAPTSSPPENEPSKTTPHVLYLRQTLRSGQSLSHKGHLVIIGDVNPGAEVIAEGDITIWGVLRGVAHAGVAGNTAAEIRALRFDPMQLRIANAIARAPDRPRQDKRSAGPEIARIINGTIRITSCTSD